MFAFFVFTGGKSMVRRLIVFLSIVTLLGIVSSADAARARYRDFTGDHLYQTAANWDVYANRGGWADYLDGTPGYGVDINIDSTKANIVSVGYEGAGHMYIDNADGSARVRGGTVVVGADNAAPGVGVIEIGKGTLAATGTAMLIGHDWGTAGAGGTGTIILNDPMSALNSNSAGKVEIGHSNGAPAVGTVQINAGNMWVGTGQVKLGMTPNSTGIINVVDGTLTHDRADNVSFYLGIDGNGELNMSGGNVTLAGRLNFSWDGVDKSGSGIVRLDGGTLSINDIFMDPADYGTDNAVIDITDGTLLVGSSRAGRIGVYANQGNIRAYGGSGTVVVTDLGGGITQVTALVPEPATLVLLSLGGLFLRRRRR